MMNLAVVSLNGGMPVSRDAVLAAGADGVILIEDGARYHLMTDADILQPFADVVPVPSPFGVVLSVGDVLLYGGLAWWCFVVTRGRFRENLRPPAHRFLMYRGKHALASYRLPARTRGTRAQDPNGTIDMGKRTIDPRPASVFLSWKGPGLERARQGMLR